MKRLMSLNYKLLAVKAAGIALIAFLVVNAPMWHLKYLEHKVGQVSIKVLKDERGTSGGSGVHIRAASGSVFILTNAHVCDLSEDGVFVHVQLKGKSRVMKRRIVEVYPNHDLCLVESLPGVRGTKLAKSVEIGESLRAIGHPQLKTLRASLGEYLSLTKIPLIEEIGYSKTSCDNIGGEYVPYLWFMACIKYYEAMETNIVVFGGSSGSATINKYGNIVGVVFAGDTRSNYAYLVPLKYIEDFLSVY